jgi:hypothetical protein
MEYYVTVENEHLTVRGLRPESGVYKSAIV